MSPTKVTLALAAVFLLSRSDVPDASPSMTPHAAASDEVIQSEPLTAATGANRRHGSDDPPTSMQDEVARPPEDDTASDPPAPPTEPSPVTPTPASDESGERLLLQDMTFDLR